MSNLETNIRGLLPRRIALMVTRRCNMKCAHCSVESHPGIRPQPDEAALQRWVREAADAGVLSILFTGGEPMLREAILLRLIELCKQLGMLPAMATNGYWGKVPADAQRRLRLLLKAGLAQMNVSYDRYHADFQTIDPVLNIARAAADIGFEINVTVTRVADDPELEGIVAPFRDFANVRMRFYDVQPVGFAKSLPEETLRANIDGFCSACGIPAITDDGRMTACNGPSYFARADSPLAVGSLAHQTIDELLDVHAQDPVLDTIRTAGPTRLLSELQSIPGFENYPTKDRYAGMCDLCTQITSDPAAIAALREHLAVSQQAAERVAAQRVISANIQSGSLNRQYVNGIGLCRAFFHAACHPEDRWTEESRKLLGRADLDWNRAAEYLIGNGLVAAVEPMVDDTELAKWAPSFFVDRIRKVAVQAAVKRLVVHDVLRTLSAALGDLGSNGVLLKGAAFQAIESSRTNRCGEDPGLPARGAGDIDIYVDPKAAPRLYASLVEAGFSERANVEFNPTHNHLPMIQSRGIGVEIHTRIARPFWGLPEDEMLRCTLETRHPELPNLHTLDAESMLLHCAVHTTSHFFSHGLKMAWDMRWISNHCAPIDWDRLRQLVRQLPIENSFWLPTCILASELPLGIADQFRRLAPKPLAAQRLESAARRRLFQSLQTGTSISKSRRYGMLFLLCNNHRQRLRVASWLTARFARRFRFRRPTSVDDVL